MCNVISQIRSFLVHSIDFLMFYICFVLALLHNVAFQFSLVEVRTLSCHFHYSSDPRDVTLDEAT